jgi:probable HAF family extracellular repeat protein
MIDLGTLGGSSSTATAVNDNGLVVGYSSLAGDATAHAFAWTALDGMVDLGTLGGSSSFATSVNDNGLVVGYSYIAGNATSHAFAWTAAGGMIDLGTLGGSSSRVRAVNDNGLVVGHSFVAGDATSHAFAWTAAGGMIDLGTLGGSSSFAHAVNDNGLVAGFSALAGDATTHAFAWTAAGGMIDLGTLGGGFSTVNTVNAVNNNGLVVGYSYVAGDATYHAALWNVAPGSGTLSVTTNLFAATFDITGPSNYSGSGLSFTVNDAPSGMYTVTYGAVGGYLTPPSETGSLSAGGALAFVGSYLSRSTGLFVNGSRLSGHQLENVFFVATTVLPQLVGTRSERIRVASRSSWWGLKEGTFSLPNPHVFSTCNRLGLNDKAKDVRLGPLEVCEAGGAWQVGLAAAQVPNFTDQQVLDVVETIWPGRAIETVLGEAARFAGFDLNQGTGAAILSTTGVLRRSWLLRHPVVGLTLVERNVTTECIDGAQPWCYGTGWPETSKYASTKPAALQSVSDLAAFFEAFVP